MSYLICTQDLIYDIRFHDYRDKVDKPFSPKYYGEEFTGCNEAALLESFNEVKDTAEVILEIGVHRNLDRSSTKVFIENKKDETYYFGVDIEDKSYLNNPDKRIFTLKLPSQNVLDVIMTISSILNKPIDEVRFSYLFIDGWHSIQQVMVDWEYSRAVDKGIIAFHDTNHHPGPSRFVDSLDRKRFSVSKCCPDDHGITFIKRIEPEDIPCVAATPAF